MTIRSTNAQIDMGSGGYANIVSTCGGHVADIWFPVRGTGVWIATRDDSRAFAHIIISSGDEWLSDIQHEGYRAVASVQDVINRHDALLSAIDDIVTAAALPGDHCELDDAIKAAGKLVEVSNER